jgi:hypothetical protein
MSLKRKPAICFPHLELSDLARALHDASCLNKNMDALAIWVMKERRLGGHGS